MFSEKQAFTCYWWRLTDYWRLMFDDPHVISASKFRLRRHHSEKVRLCNKENIALGSQKCCSSSFFLVFVSEFDWGGQPNASRFLPVTWRLPLFYVRYHRCQNPSANEAIRQRPPLYMSTVDKRSNISIKTAPRLFHVQLANLSTSNDGCNTFGKSIRTRLDLWTVSM